MQSFYRTADRNWTVDFKVGAPSCRWLGMMIFGAAAALWLVPGTIWAQSGSTIDISPMVARAKFLSATDPAKEISVVLSLPLGDSKGAAEFVQLVSTPGDPLYKHYITPQEYAARFGANAADYAALKEWATASGLKITHESSARTILTVSGTAAQFETLFKTQINNYRSGDGSEFYTASIKPTIPSAVASRISGVIGLTDSVRYGMQVPKIAKTFGENDAAVIGTDTAGGTGPGGAYAPKDLRAVYNIPSLGGFSSQTVAVFAQGGFYASDVKKYFTKMNLKEPPIKFVSVDYSDGSVNDPGIELEAVTNIDMIVAINPDVKEVLVYEDARDNFAVALLDAIDQVGTDNKAQVFMISYGADEKWQQAFDEMAQENTALMQLAAQGITVIASASDKGAYGNIGWEFLPKTLDQYDPATQPLVTCIGGTSLYTNESKIYVGEQVWNDLAIQAGATGGGISVYWALPSWQKPFMVTANGGSSSFRNIPDVSAVADPLTGVAVYSKMNGGWIQAGGNGVSAAIWAGYISILNSTLNFFGGGNVGYFNPTLYTYIGPFAGITFDYLYDVIGGTNGNTQIYGIPGFSAGSAYDNCTGWGTPWGAGFAYELLVSQPGSSPPSPIIALAAKQTSRTTAEVTWNASVDANGYAVVLAQRGGVSGFNIAHLYVTKEHRYKLTGLNQGETYTVFAAAVNKSAGTGTGINFQMK
jgi:subtilase family serine protease